MIFLLAGDLPRRKGAKPLMFWWNGSDELGRNLMGFMVILFRPSEVSFWLLETSRSFLACVVVNPENINAAQIISIKFAASGKPLEELLVLICPFQQSLPSTHL